MIPAGGSGKLVARIHTGPSQNGRVSKTIRVVTDDPVNRTIVLRLSADVASPVQVLPSARLWLDTWEGRGVSRKLLLHRSDGKPLHVLDLKVDDQLDIAVTRASVREPEEKRGLRALPGDVWLTATLPATPSVRSSTGKIVLTTNDPQEKEVRIKVSVRVRPLIEAVPSQVRFVVPNQGGAKIWRVVQLRHNGGGAFSILSVRSDRADLLGAEILTRTEGRFQQVKITLNNALAEKAKWRVLRGGVTVVLNDRARKELTIPVIISRRRTAPARRSPAVRRIQEPVTTQDSGSSGKPRGGR